MCDGIGTNYLITVTDSAGSVVYESTTPTGTIPLSASGDYTATCTVDGDAGVSCDETLGELTIEDIRNLLIAYGYEVDPLIAGTCDISWESFPDSPLVDLSAYLNLSHTAMAELLASDTFSYVFLRGIQHSCEPNLINFDCSGNECTTITLLPMAEEFIVEQCEEACTEDITVFD